MAKTSLAKMPVDASLNLRTGGRYRVALDWTKRVFTNIPPMILRPRLPDDLSGFSTIDELIGRLPGGDQPTFPYEQELALYLLLIASLWPDDHERLLTAARIFSGALNFHFSRARDAAATSARYRALRRELSRAKIKSFNERFFSKIGGPPSLLFCPSIEEFHRDLWKRIAELTIIHDFTEYLFKSSILSKRISSASFAYHAIANNVFAREGGYGVPGGPKRNRRATAVTTAESVRAKCKNAPDTVILSFIMTRWYGFHFYDPADPRFFHVLFNLQGSSSAIKAATSIIGDRLLKDISSLNTSVTKWANFKIPPLDRSARLHTLSAEELERVFKISESVFKKPIGQEQRDVARQNLQWWLKPSRPHAQPSQQSS